MAKEVKVKDWKKELARDFLALGSWIFYILVVARAWIRPYRPFIDQVIIAGIILIILSFIIKDNENYVARGLVLTFFIILFYKDPTFSFFAILVMIGLLVSSYIIGNDIKKITKGTITGVVVIAISYWLASLNIVG